MKKLLIISMLLFFATPLSAGDTGVVIVLESQVTLTASGLGAGMYLYALVADGALVDSKQMILTK